jgi:hypothetical protein
MLRDAEDGGQMPVLARGQATRGPVRGTAEGMQ